MQKKHKNFPTHYPQWPLSEPKPGSKKLCVKQELATHLRIKSQNFLPNSQLDLFYSQIACKFQIGTSVLRKYDVALDLMVTCQNKNPIALPDPPQSEVGCLDDHPSAGAWKPRRQALVSFPLAQAAKREWCRHSKDNIHQGFSHKHKEQKRHQKGDNVGGKKDQKPNLKFGVTEIWFHRKGLRVAWL